MPPISGDQFGPYLVENLLGAGGMGEVWRARDTRLDRFVALKILQGSWAEQPEWLSRFRQEAKAVAALNHPNILSLYDLGSERGVHYAVMELLEGETLRESLTHGPLSLRTCLDLAQQMARGLTAAHEKGIIHRDLKPENLWIAGDGRLKILDFGLAKQTTVALAPSGSQMATEALAHHTQAGTLVGTLGYMSPEQVRGEEVDARSDLFAFGAVLWEMLTGLKAFARPSAAETLAAILKEDPAESDRLQRELPPGLVRVLQHCLDKRAEGRFHGAKDLAFALEAISEGPALSAPKRAALPTLAVLPFVNLSQSKDQDYFSDGVSEEIINALMKVDGLKVAARTSSFAFKGKDGDVRHIGEALGVQFVLEGSVRIAGERLRVSAQLIGIEDGCQRWSDRFDRTLADVFDVQDEIARAIARALEIRLVAHAEDRLVERATQDPEAYDLVLRGRAFYSQRAAAQAADCFEAALNRDSSYVEAYTGLADACAVQGYYGGVDCRAAFSRGKAAAERALALAPDSAAAHVSLGILEHYYGWDFTREERLLRRAIELNPRSASAHYWLSLRFNLHAEPERGRALAERCVELEPMSPNAVCALGFLHYPLGRFEEALVHFERGHALDPSALFPRTCLGLCFQALGRPAEAVSVLEGVQGTGRHSTYTEGLLGSALVKAGRRAEAEDLLRQLRDRASREYVTPLHVAFIEAALGDIEAGFDSLERALAERNALTWFFIPRESALAPLRDHPGFPGLLAHLHSA
jgi:serine/threonine-protein kinase